MVRQLLGKYRVKDMNLQRYCAEASELLKTAPFKLEIIHVEREKNAHADLLANTAIDRKELPNF